MLLFGLNGRSCSRRVRDASVARSARARPIPSHAMCTLIHWETLARQMGQFARSRAQSSHAH
eukprot:7384999-Prymnesium_polylepis.4